MIYVISVCGPKMYTLHELHRELMAKLIQQQQFFRVVEMSPHRLLYSAYSIDCTLEDKFELHKNGATSTYFNHAN